MQPSSVREHEKTGLDAIEAAVQRQTGLMTDIEAWRQKSSAKKITDT